MRLSRRVEFHGERLEDVHPAVVIKSVNKGSPKKNTTAADRAGGYGQRITGAQYQYLESTVTFAIDVPKNLAGTRAQVFDRVRKWACGQTGRGVPDNPWLNISFAGRQLIQGITIPSLNGTTEIPADSNGQQRLYVDEVVFPEVGDLYDWLKEYTITFKAYTVPFWQDVSGAGGSSNVVSSGSVGLNVPGQVKTPVNVRVQNRSGHTIDTITLWTDAAQIKLTGLGLGGYDTLVVDHGAANGLLSLSTSQGSVYEKYSGDNDLLINPGTQELYFSAGRAVYVYAEAYGRYL